jgi:hypothetical protein
MIAIRRWRMASGDAALMPEVRNVQQRAQTLRADAVRGEQ